MRPGLFLQLAVLLTGGVAAAQSIEVKPDRADVAYRSGDTIVWTVTANGLSGDLTYVVKPNQGPPTTRGTLANTGSTLQIKTKSESPGTVLIEVTGRDTAGKGVGGTGGAVVDADRIGPSAPRPADFDAFWDGELARLRAVPACPEVTRGVSPRDDVVYEKVRLDGPAGSKIYGQVAKPAKGDKFPAAFRMQWAGVYPLNPQWVVEPAVQGWLTLNIEAHDLPIDRKPSFYRAQYAGPLKNYWAIGNDDRETSYYRRMYLSCVQAVEYLRTRPDWDGKTLVVFGGSQGGQLALVTAALCDGVTAAMADVPAGCDMLGPVIGRRGGFPQWYDQTTGVDGRAKPDPARVREASRYYDVVNFAPRIRCPVLVSTGLIDDTCPSAGIIAAYNALRSPKTLVIMPAAGHMSKDNAHQAFEHALWQKWLPALAKSIPAPVK